MNHREFCVDGRVVDGKSELGARINLEDVVTFGWWRYAPPGSGHPLSHPD